MIEKGDNIAPQAKVTASQKGGDGTSDPKYINDEIVTPDGTGATKWFLLTDCMDAWAEFDFGKNVSIKEALVINGNTASSEKDIVKAFQFQYNKDGKWLEVPGSTIENNTEFEVRVLFSEPINCDKIRFVSLTKEKFRIREIELYEAVDGSSNVYTETMAPSVSSVDGTQWEEAVNTLFNLGILSDRYVSDFNPEKILSGKVYLDMILEMFGYSVNNIEGELLNENVFDRNASFAIDMKWLDAQDLDKFTRNEEITYSDATKIMLRALGYRNHAESGNGTFGYAKYANILDLHQNVTNRQDGYINYGDAAAIMFNALEAPVIEQFVSGTGYIQTGKRNFLDVYKNIKSDFGVVESTYFSYMKSRVDQKYVRINDVNYLSGSSSVNSFFGMNVKYYYKTEPEKEILYAREYNNKLLKISGNDIVDNSQLSYLKYSDASSGKIREARISSNAFYFINGALPDKNPINLTISNGEYNLIDNNHDGIYDVVLINEYKLVIVDKIDLENGIIYGKNGVNNIKLSDKEVYLIFKNNLQIPLDDIKLNSIISVAESKNGELARLYVSEKKISGEIAQEFNDGEKLYLRINGSDYEIDHATRNSAFGNNGSCVSMSATFYFDYNGKIVYVDEVVDESLKFGLVLAMAPPKVFGNYQVKIYDSNGKINIYSLADKVYINQNRYSGDSNAIAQNLSINGETQLLAVRYSLNRDGDVKTIYTSSGTIADESDYKESYGEELVRYADAENYYSHKGALIDPNGDRDIILSDETIIFKIPADVSKRTDDEKFMEVGTGVSTIETFTGLDGTIELYNMNTDGIPEMMVFVWDKQPIWLQANTATSVVVSTFMSINEDGELRNGCEVYTNGECKEIIFSENCVYNTSYNNFLSSSISGYNTIVPSEFKTGDCIQYTLNNFGEVCMYRVLFRASDAGKDTPIQYTGGSSDAAKYYPPIETYVGYLNGYSSDAYTIKSNGVLKRFPTSVPNVYICDSTRRNLYKGTLNDVITITNDSLNPSKVFVRVKEKRITDIVVYE